MISVTVERDYKGTAMPSLKVEIKTDCTADSGIVTEKIKELLDEMCQNR